MAILLGVDPGSIHLGYGLIEARGDRLTHLAHGHLDAARRDDLPQRLALLYEGLTGLLDRYRPDSVGIEKVFTARNAHAALTLGHARGMILLAIGQRGLSLAEYAPAEIKLSVGGHGRCSKDRIAAMVERLLSISLEPDERDSSDALAVAICHAHGRRRQRLLERAAHGSPR